MLPRQTLGAALANSRKFVGRWRVEKIEGGFVVVAANGFRLAYVYARDDEIMRIDHLSPAEAEKIALAIARLPDLWPEKRKCPLKMA